jgi:ABC-type antimicrobial peptide transport system permease subunit
VIARTNLELETGAKALRDAVWLIDPELALAEVTTMNSLLRDSVARPRFTTLLLSLFSALALLLTCVGVYGIVAYSVAQRTREMGIRIALGAQSGEIVGLVLREGLAPAALGIGIGIVGALFLTRMMKSLLFGITPTDVTTYVLVTGVLGLAAFAAAWVPARRAVRVDPLDSLRAE